jgi:hypothetical protein
MDSPQRFVRSSNGLIPRRSAKYTLEDIRLWRHCEHDAGRPNGLDDFYTAHGLCVSCRGDGVRFVGWSNPLSVEEEEACKALKWDQLPLYAICNQCQGTGSASR